MNPKEVFHNPAYSVQLPYIAGHSLYWKVMIFDSFYEILNSVNFRGRTSKTTDWEDTRGSDKGKLLIKRD